LKTKSSGSLDSEKYERCLSNITKWLSDLSLNETNTSQNSYKKLQDKFFRQYAQVSALDLILDFDTDLAIPVQSDYCRMIKLQFKNSVLQPEGWKYSSGRFNYKGDGPPVLYLASDRNLAEREISCAFDKPAPPMVVVWVKVQLQKVLDLTDSSTVKKVTRFGKNIEKLQWEYENLVLSRASLTQSLAAVAMLKGFEAIRYVSSKNEGEQSKDCIAIFYNNIAPESSLHLNLEGWSQEQIDSNFPNSPLHLP
jgi:hypothetical protein